MIAINDLSVNYQSPAGSFAALSHINLTIPTGTICAVIGPSGCGKSTLLKVIAGIVHDYDGAVLMDSQPVNPQKSVIGFMPQDYGLLPWKNIADNICLGAKIKQGGRIDPMAFQEIVQRLHLSGLEQRYPAELSGGQQQRASLARSFLLQPELLLMDEPFSALDAMTREEMQDVFLSLWQKYTTTAILVTHYVEEAVYLGQQIVVLSDSPGRIRAVIENPLFGGRAIRQTSAFFAMGLKLRALLKRS